MRRFCKQGVGGVVRTAFLGALARGGALALAILVGGMSGTAAQDGPSAFAGKQVRFFTMGSPGGGYDTYAHADTAARTPAGRQVGAHQ